MLLDAVWIFAFAKEREEIHSVVFNDARNGTVAVCVQISHLQSQVLLPDSVDKKI